LQSATVYLSVSGNYLDYEERQNVTFSLVATDINNPEFTISQEFTINIQVIHCVLGMCSMSNGNVYRHM
jgi:hypothetical protein